MKKLLITMICGALIAGTGGSLAYAGEVDVLVEKLVEKGVLTPLEAQIIKDETMADVAKQNAQGKNNAIPKWIQTMKLKGDFRLRYQYERRENDTEGRERGRIRYRLGILSDVTDQWKVGAGLASGGASARSTNQTLGDVTDNNAFDKGDIRLDYAFAEFSPNKNVKIVGGKFKRKPYLWLPTDMTWDGDVNPEGGAFHVEHGLTKEIDGFVNGGVLILDHEDQADRTDPFMTYVQGGIVWKHENLDAKLAGTFYSFDGLKGEPSMDSSDSNADTNTYVNGVYKYDYDSGHLGAELGIKELFGGLPFGIDNRIAFFGEYVNNPDPEEQNTGWAAGMKFGHKKVSKPNTWQAKYIYVSLGKDAWVDFLPDSDRYDPGRTDVKSHEISLQYAFKKNVIFGLDYYNSDRIKSAKNRDQLIQADLVLKF